MNPTKPKFEYPDSLLPQTVEIFERIRVVARNRILAQRKRHAGPPAGAAPEAGPQRIDRGCPND